MIRMKTSKVKGNDHLKKTNKFTHIEEFYICIFISRITIQEQSKYTCVYMAEKWRKTL